MVFFWISFSRAETKGSFFLTGGSFRKGVRVPIGVSGGSTPRRGTGSKCRFLQEHCKKSQGVGCEGGGRGWGGKGCGLTLIFFSLRFWKAARKTTKKARISYACRTPEILEKEGGNTQNRMKRKKKGKEIQKGKEKKIRGGKGCGLREGSSGCSEGMGRTQRRVGGGALNHYILNQDMSKWHFSAPGAI